VTGKSGAQSKDGDEINPKIHPAPNSNTDKEPEDGLGRRPDDRSAGLLPQNPFGGVRRAKLFRNSPYKGRSFKTD
jgi:hypothetical protein